MSPPMKFCHFPGKKCQNLACQNSLAGTIFAMAYRLFMPQCTFNEWFNFKTPIVMSLVKFAPSTLFGSSNLPVFSSLMENFFGRDMFDLTNQSFGSTLPAVNIRETNDDFLVDVAAPGMKKEDFKVVLENNLLTISAE